MNKANLYELAGQNEKNEGNFPASEWFFEQADKIKFEEQQVNFAATVIKFMVNSSKVDLFKTN